MEAQAPSKEPSQIPFQGISTTHADYQAPPADAMKDAVNFQAPAGPTWPAAKFEGESSLHRDYPAPPLEALRQMLKSHETVPAPKANFRFEGESCMRADYQAPPLTAFHQPSREPSREPQQPTPDVQEALRSWPDIVKESTSHHDYQPPCLDDLRIAQTIGSAPQLSHPAVRFQGESVMHGDYQAPPALALRRDPPEAEKPLAVQSLLQPDVHLLGRSTTHHDYQAPPHETLKQATQVPEMPQAMPQARFQGTSTTHADYQAPPADAMKDAVNFQAPAGPTWPAAKFEGESSLHRDYPAPPLEALRQMLKSHETVPAPKANFRFEGESCMRADYQAPPLTAFHQPSREPSREPQQPTPDVQEALRSWPDIVKESTSHHDYQPPCLDDLRISQTIGSAPQLSHPAVRFQGESVMHGDYQAPPALALRRDPPEAEKPPAVQSLLQPDVHLLGRSTTHHDYQAPPHETLKQATQVPETPQAMPQARFQGTSTTHADYQAPPADAMKDAVNFQAPAGPTWPAAKFEGESSLHRDYPAPPLEALRQMLKSHETVPAPKANFRFEGESCMRADYQAPPLTAFHQPSREPSREPQQPTPDVQEALRSWPDIVKESTSHHDYQPPCLDDYRPPLQSLRQWLAGVESPSNDVSKVRFDGESSMKLHYQPPPLDALHKGMPEEKRQKAWQHSAEDHVHFEGESTTHRDFQAPPLQSLQEWLQAAGTSTGNSAITDGVPFEGESSMKAHYPAHPVEPLQVAAGKLDHQVDLHAAEPVPFEGQSTTHNAYQAPSAEFWRQLGQNMDRSSTQQAAPVRFEGESSMRAHYQPPPPDALQSPATSLVKDKAMAESTALELAKFEGQSTMHRDFQAPALEQPPLPRPPASHDTSPPIRFEGESSMKAHYPAHPVEPLQVAAGKLDHQVDLHAAEPVPFEGQSTTHQAYQAPSADFWRQLGQSMDRSSTQQAVPVRFEGESSMRAHYQPPPPDALQSPATSLVKDKAMAESTPRQLAKFEGQSTMHRDFQAPALEQPLLPRPPASHDTSPPIRFEGESSMKAHYPAHPVEPLQVAAGKLDHQVDPHAAEPVPFEGQSTTHQAYQAPSAEFWRQLGQNMDRSSTQQAAPVRFEGESSMRAHYQPPPPDALQSPATSLVQDKAMAESTALQLAKFEGQSTMHRDFQAPSLEQPPLPRPAASYDTSSAIRFEGESSMKAHYPAHPVEPLQVAAGKLDHQVDLHAAEPVPFEGQSTTHQAYQALSVEFWRQLGQSMDRSSTQQAALVRFEGESSMRAHYQPPPPDALQSPATRLIRDKAMAESTPLQLAKFEGESTMHRDFQAPALEQPPLPRPAASYDTSPPIRFEGESSMKAHYPAHPVEPLQVAAGKLDHQVDLHAAEPVPFEGQSTTHQAYQSPSAEFWRQLGQSMDRSSTQQAAQVRFEGESSMRAHYQPPPPDALQSPATSLVQDKAMAESTALQLAKFEGQSTMHRDFQAPALEQPPLPRPAASHDTSSAIRFEGESSMKAHYPAHPVEPLQVAAGKLDHQVDLHAAEPVPFEGQSTTHQAYQAPSAEFWRQLGQNMDRSSTQQAAPVRFEGESSMRSHYQPPPPDELQSLPTSLVTDTAMAESTALQLAKFEGQSTMHRDFQAPALEQPPLPRPAASYDTSPPIRFEGESSMKAHYPAHPVAPLQVAAGKLDHQVDLHAAEPVPFEGQSTTHQAYQAPSAEFWRQLGQRMDRSSTEQAAPVRFEGESSMRSQYQPPPPDALQSLDTSLVTDKAMAQSAPLQLAKFEGQSTMHRDFQAPALEQPPLPRPPASHDKSPPIRFEGESSMKAHYPAHPVEPLQAAAGKLDHQVDLHAAEPVPFEGQSTTHQAYQTPSTDFWRQLGQSMDKSSTQQAAPVRFEGESSMRAQYQAPPPKSAAANGHIEGKRMDQIKFEGQSTTHQDYRVPPVEELQKLIAGTSSSRTASHERKPACRFEGESSMRAHYRAPSPDAVRGAATASGQRERSLPPDRIPSSKFEGESTARRDFQAPLPELRYRPGNGTSHSSNVPPAVPLRFEGESSMRAHYQAPPPESFPLAAAANGHIEGKCVDQIKFEGQSTTHQDYRVPPVEELQKLIAGTSSSRTASRERKPACRFEGESSMRAHYRAPSPDAVRGAATASGQRERSLPADRIPSSKFEGESTARRDFQAPLPELRYPPGGGTSHSSNAPPAVPLRFEGESSMRAHYQAPPPESFPLAAAANGHIEGKCVDQTKFEGQSTTHQDYWVPPVEELQKLIAGTSSSRTASHERKPACRFEGESSMRAHYRAPSPDAVRGAATASGQRERSLPPDRIPSSKFEGESTARRDFQAPLPELRYRPGNGTSHSSNVPPAVPLRFEGESSMRAHYQAPPPESFPLAAAANGHIEGKCVDQTKFEGQSTTHQDYRVPPVEELQKLITGTSSSRTASRERKPACRFEGESSMRAHYRAPSPDAVRVATSYLASGQGRLLSAQLESVRTNDLPTDRLERQSLGCKESTTTPAWAVVPGSFGEHGELEAEPSSFAKEPNNAPRVARGKYQRATSQNVAFGEPLGRHAEGEAEIGQSCQSAEVSNCRSLPGMTCTP